MLLRVIDIETTGTSPPDAEIVEIGRVDVHWDGSFCRIGKALSRLYRPLGEIPPEVLAVHHITLADIPSDAPVCTPERIRLAVWGGELPDVLVAHNNAFERSFITKSATDALPWLCTYKSALQLWPEAPRHSNQVLRYWRRLEIDPALAMPPHRAGPDCVVTAYLLADLLKQASVEQMVKWTCQPKNLPTIPFGKHRGLRWDEAPLEYLRWMTTQPTMEADLVWLAQTELRRRQGTQYAQESGHCGSRFNGRKSVMEDTSSRGG